MRKCPNCGMDNKPSANFCRGCGTRLPAEAAVELRGNPNERSAAKKTGKKSWMKIAVPVLILAAIVILSRQTGLLSQIGPGSSCETCNEILDLQQQLQETLKKNEDNSITGMEYEQWSAQVAALSGDIQLLQEHECTAPIRKVKEHECVYGRYIGSYTGEWKSTAPCGEGSFTGSYREGDTQFVCIYSGTWSGGAPNGTGSMMEHREYQGDSSTENWTTRLYEGTFADGKLTGSGWSSFESASGDRYEYFDGTYRNGFLEGQVNFLHYRDGELYDKGVAEGSKFIPVYSQRQEITDTLQTVGGLVVVGVGLYTILDSAFPDMNSAEFKNSGAGRWYAEQSAAIQADMDQWRENKAREQTEKQLYDTWQALEGRVKWCETSKYTDEQEDADYFRDQADDARKAYEAFK